MSVIAVRRYKEKIVIASDTQITWGDNKVQKNSELFREEGKIYKINGLVVGVTGAIEETNLMRIFCKSHKPSDKRVDSILDFFVEFWEWGKEKKDKFDVDNHYLIVIGDKIYQCAGLRISEVNEFNAVGSGMFLAIGAMSQGADPEEAVEVAKKYDLYCGGDTYKIELLIKNK